jgi:hypothetical protein
VNVYHHLIHNLLKDIYENLSGIQHHSLCWDLSSVQPDTQIGRLSEVQLHTEHHVPELELVQNKRGEDGIELQERMLRTEPS